MNQLNELTEQIIGCSIEVHRHLGPGLLESVYEKALCYEFNVPALREWGVTEADLPGIVEKAAHASSMQANPVPLTREELLAVLTAAL